MTRQPSPTDRDRAERQTRMDYWTRLSTMPDSEILADYCAKFREDALRSAEAIKAAIADEERISEYVARYDTDEG